MRQSRMVCHPKPAQNEQLSPRSQDCYHGCGSCRDLSEWCKKTLDASCVLRQVLSSLEKSKFARQQLSLHRSRISPSDPLGSSAKIDATLEKRLIALTRIAVEEVNYHSQMSTWSNKKDIRGALTAFCSPWLCCSPD